MWCSTPHLGGQRSHGLGVGAVGKPLLPFGGARLPPVSLAPSCQKIFTENVLHRGALRLKPPILWPVATACSICGARLTSRGAKVARTRGWRRWKAAPPFWGGASASRFAGTFLSKDIHRKRPAPSTLSILLCKAATASSICGARLHISGGKGRTDSGSAPLESRSSLLGGRVCLPFLWHLPVKRYSPKTSCTEHT